MRKGERLIACAKRKAFEETGLKVEVEQMVGIYDDPSSNPVRHDVTVAFLCQSAGGRIIGSWQGTEILFFPLNKLPHKLGFAVRQEVRDARKLLNIRLRR